MVNSGTMSVLERLIGDSRYSRLLTWMYKPVDGASIAVFRFGYGAIMLWEVTRYFEHNWIKSYYTDKLIYLKYPGFSWVHPWPTLELMEWHFILIAVLGTMVMVGFCYRFAATFLAVTFSYVYLLEQARYLNHFYFVILVAVAMIFVPANRSWSVDSFLKRRYNWWPFLDRCSSFTDNWGVWAVKAQFGITYFYGGIAKLNHDWLRGQPLTKWISNDSHLPLIGPYVHEEWMGLALSYAGLITDLAFVPLLLWRKTRWFGLLLALSFNVMNDQLFSIGIFPIFMIVGTTLFMEPDWPKRFWDFCTLSKDKCAASIRIRLASAKEQSSLLSKITTRQKLLAGFMVAFFAFQFLFPFRHFLYPGTVHWTEEGHMYSWHMKLRSKRGRVEFIIKDPKSGRMFSVDPDDYLTKRQERKMSTRPTMMLQFAHWLRDHYQEQGMINVEVYAESFAALNGRPEQRFIDPSVDLAKVNWSIFPAHWILPLEDTWGK